MLFVLLLIPWLLMPGRRRIGSVGEAQLFANRPVDVADVGAGQRDSELRIGRAEEKLLPRGFGFVERGPELLLVAIGREKELDRNRPRSDERRGGKEGVSKCRSRGVPEHS